MHSVLHPPSTVYTMYGIHYIQHVRCTAYTRHRIHIVWYTLSAAFTMYIIITRLSNFLLSMSCYLLFIPWYTTHSTVPWIWVNQEVEFQLQSCPPSTSSKCIYKLAWLLPPSSHYHSMQVYLHSGPIMAFKFQGSWAPRAAPLLENHCHQAYVSTHYLTVLKIEQPRPISSFLNSLNYSLVLSYHTMLITPSMYFSELTQSQSRSASLNSLHHNFQMHLYMRTITSSTCISKFNQPWA